MPEIFWHDPCSASPGERQQILARRRSSNLRPAGIGRVGPPRAALVSRAERSPSSPASSTIDLSLARLLRRWASAMRPGSRVAAPWRRRARRRTGGPPRAPGPPRQAPASSRRHTPRLGGNRRARRRGRRPSAPANGRARNGRRATKARGVIVSMACGPSGELIVVVETIAGRLILRAAAADRVFVTWRHALVQTKRTCGPLRRPACRVVRARERVSRGFRRHGRVVRSRPGWLAPYCFTAMPCTSNRPPARSDPMPRKARAGNPFVK